MKKLAFSIAIALTIAGCGYAGMSRTCTKSCGNSLGLEISTTAIGGFPGTAGEDSKCHCKTDKGWELKE